jgi:hypothetical protein
MPAAILSAAAAGPSPTAGGATFSIAGAGFGPSGIVGAVDFALYGANGTALNATAATILRAFPLSNTTALTSLLPPGIYAASSCTVASDALITCLTGPGIGTGMSVVLSIGGQMNAAGAFPAGVSYAAPQVSSVSGPGATAASTLGQQMVIVAGSNFGPADLYTVSQLVVTYSASEADDGSSAVTAVNDPSSGWVYTASSCNVSMAHVQITCLTVVGGGRGLAWSVSVAGLASTHPTSSYAPPYIANVTLADGVTPLVDGASAAGGQLLALVVSVTSIPADTQLLKALHHLCRAPASGRRSSTTRRSRC